MCGVFGISNARDAARLTYLGLFALQHRGQESAGIASLHEGRIHEHRGRGLVSDVFSETLLNSLPGNCAIGHVRYSTAGGNLDANIQPLLARIGGVPVALSHNGNIVNAPELREALESSGAILQGTADTELVLHVMARARENSVPEKLISAFSQLLGAFSMLIQTPTHLHAIVDAAGYRPLVLGRLPQSENGAPSWVVSSETCALDLVGAEFVRDLAPGELLSIELATGVLASRSFDLTPEQSKNLQQARCSFEHIYFARPDSLLWGQSSFDMRHRLGEILAHEAPVNADMVIAIPDSGIPMAMGYAHASKIPYKVGLIRNHYVGRTFIEPTQNVRNFRVRLKLNPVRETVRGKKLVVIDDSIVRGTTSKKIIELLRDAGAAEIHMRIGSPPVRFPCFYGIDTPKRKELLAQKMTAAEMSEFLKADSLGFLSQENLVKAMGESLKKEKSNCGFCTSCFTGDYQDSCAQSLGHLK